MRSTFNLAINVMFGGMSSVKTLECTSCSAPLARVLLEISDYLPMVLLLVPLCAFGYQTRFAPRSGIKPNECYVRRQARCDPRGETFRDGGGL